MDEQVRTPVVQFIHELAFFDLPRSVGLAESTLLHLFDVDFEIPGTVVVHDPTSPRNRRRPWG